MREPSKKQQGGRGISHVLKSAKTTRGPPTALNFGCSRKARGVANSENLSCLLACGSKCLVGREQGWETGVKGRGEGGGGYLPRRVRIGGLLFWDDA